MNDQRIQIEPTSEPSDGLHRGLEHCLIDPLPEIHFLIILLQKPIHQLLFQIHVSTEHHNILGYPDHSTSDRRNGLPECQDSQLVLEIVLLCVGDLLDLEDCDHHLLDVE